METTNEIEVVEAVKAEDKPADLDEGKTYDQQDEGKSEAEKQAAREAREKRSSARYRELERKVHDTERKALFFEEALRVEQEKLAKLPEKPARADFADDEAYLDARDAYVEAKVKAGAKAELAEQQARHSNEDVERTTKQAYAARAKAFIEKVPDFDDLIAAAEGRLVLSPDAGRAVFESDLGPDVVHYLATHLDVADKVAGLSPRAQVKELGRIEERLTTTKPTVATSRAPAPITPTRGSGGQFERDPTSMSAKEYEAWRLKDKPRWAR